MHDDEREMEKECHQLGYVGDVKIGVRHRLESQDILIEHSDRGQRLACLLAPVAPEMERRDDTLYWRIPHSPEVDHLLTKLTDLFISIRFAHPTLVQLEFDLDGPAEWAIEGADGL